MKPGCCLDMYPPPGMVRTRVGGTRLMIAVGCLAFATMGYRYEAMQNTDWSIQASILPQ